MNSVQFLSGALVRGLRLSLREAIEIDEFKSEDTFKALDNVRSFCGDHNIRCVPPFDEGELDEGRFFSLDKGEDIFEEAIEKALQDGESHTVEFKASSFLDIDRLDGGHFEKPQDLISKSVEHEIVKTLSAFLNADGGILLVGVKDDHSVCGVEVEFGYLKGSKKDRDGWELRLSGKLEAALLDYREVVGHLQQRFVKRDGLAVYAIMVTPRRERIAACKCESLKSEVAYQRAGNRSNKLTPHAIEGLVRQRLSET